MNARIFAMPVLLALVCMAAPARAADYPAVALAPVDPQIQSMVNAIAASDLRDFDTKLVGFGTRNDFSEQLNSPTRGVFAARDWLKAQFDAIAAQTGGRMTVTLDTYMQPKTARTPRDVLESSVIATLKGDDPSASTYVMSGHYDDCNGSCVDGEGDAPGADDNGSGSAAVLEAAKAMAKTHFRGTIVFAIFDGEELGLWGSGHFAHLLKTQGVHVAANLNNDIIGASVDDRGRPDPNEVRLFSQSLANDAKVPLVNLLGSENDSPSRELARFVKTTSEQYNAPMTVEQIFRADRFLRGGDQESFQTEGFPAVRFVEAHETFIHQHHNVRVVDGVQQGDLLPYIDFDYMARVTKMNVAALAALAMGPEVPDGAAMLTRALGNETTLSWKPVTGATSYEIVWRATDSPEWQYSKDVGNVATATVDVSKDDYILGVRAVDAKGHRSVVAYPTPPARQ